MIQSFAAMLAIVALAAGQDPPPAVSQLEDVEVIAEARADMARTFVSRIVAPARGRGLGRWTKICPGIANLDQAVAQPIVDRLATRAVDLGIEIEGPGCEANIIVVFTTDARALTRALVANEPRVFRHGGGGIDRGGAALRAFQDSERPVRWWSLSVPINSGTGQRAVRVPGDRVGGPTGRRFAQVLGCRAPSADCVGVGAPIVQSTFASRLNSQIVDQLYKAIIIVDIDAVSGLSTDQLGDYLAMVTLAQIDPEADTGAFDTVLNLFDNPQGVPGLSEWDQSYLSALYSSPSRRRSAGAQANAVAAIMRRTVPVETGQ
jgi:hypothetical protein